ncbi:cob(I)yrinic acid a,c-diamide adenosyltransferase [Anaerobacterium chartisolvens]|uniref:Cob(I)yrinic acid a,c-diamide adenosyltransferase n=1 Tax=Anaerobacterium chartisolvens TaxID=1297424 RepID=A0A369B7S9_9FIRM|nr:cob(I)yrinic acid a,c-diamide adenosyltransferase [Anaerobacterium chartisolvens]RCX17582.1 cob(I)yrinic acid a,c-diamide adenosyltransferase [Anaerobacterium chartisolvens]
MDKGLVHIYTGDGKGKTTAAVGLGVRAYGRGLKVLMVQFLKSRETGEVSVLENFSPRFKLARSKECDKFTWNMDKAERQELKKTVTDLLEYAEEEAASGRWDMIILDEIMACISIDAICVSRVSQMITSKPEGLELVMTGRNAPAELIRLADYVSEISAVKHPFTKGIAARTGIEN